MSPKRGRTTHSSVADPKAVFSFFWGSEAVWHVLVTPGLLHAAGPTRSVDAALAVAGVSLMAEPSAVPLLGVVAALELVSIGLELPVIGNNWLLAGAGDVVILAALALHLARRRRAVDRDQLWRQAAPALRPIALVLYVFAALAKFNHAFVDLAVSCGPHFLGQSLRTVGLAGVAGSHTAGWGAIGATLAIEGLVPVLLLVRPTRTLGVVLGLAFHGAIAVNRYHPFGDFSSVMFALLLTWLPESFAASIPAAWWRARWLFAASSLVLFVEAARRRPPAKLSAGGALLWAFLALATLGAVARWWWQTRSAPLTRPFSGAPTVLFAVSAVLAVNGATPYLGIKNGVAFNMYSNLSVADGRSNNVLLGRTLQLSHALSDPVTILSSSDGGLTADAGEGWALTWDAFRDYGARHPDASVRYERAGKVIDVPRIGDDPALRPRRGWEHRAMTLRLIDLRQPARCEEFFLVGQGDG